MTRDDSSAELAKQFRALQAALSGALDLIPVPACLLELSGRFRWINDEARRLVGDVVGRPFSTVVPADQAERARAQFARKLTEHRTTVFELDLVGPRGRHVAVEVTSAPLLINGRPVGVFGVAIPQGQKQGGGGAAGTAPVELTARQREALQLLGEGLGTDEIARRMDLAEETVRNHVRALLRQLGAHSRLEAVVLAQKQGLLEPPSPG